MARERQEGTGARLAIDRAADGVFLGRCGLANFDPAHRSARMGYSVLASDETQLTYVANRR